MDHLYLRPRVIVTRVFLSIEKIEYFMNSTSCFSVWLLG
ncbi:hypothetical Protein YC6258_02740 [Gynuella sunshinyii YC6258]|uniref:Uncharacterized protein n=1 Tax=Gynuella sunshinyii YC6258 TaxID=1445510 RepID=A0A0C5VN66_9GAMM|nr:hypothetical Protein YC6258_02740 [Gynuella sunshinyii YC6258]